MLPGVVLVTIACGALWSGVVTWLRTRGPRGTARPDGPVPTAVIAALRARSFPESPAVLNTTVFELAEQGVLTIEPADSTHPALVRTESVPHASSLPPYQASVVSRLLHRQGAGGRPVPLSALQPGEDAGARAWHKQFVREVRAEASRRGLLRLPVVPGLYVLFVLVGVVCAGSVGATVAHYRPGVTAFGAFVFSAALAVATLHWATRVSLTPTGRRLLAAQQSAPDPDAALAQLLRPELALPAAAPAPQAGARVLPNQLQPLPPHLVWSDYGGAWHPVNVQSRETYSLDGNLNGYAPLVFFAAISLGGAFTTTHDFTHVATVSIAVFAGLPVLVLLVAGVNLLRRRRLPKRAVLIGQVAKLWSVKRAGANENESLYCTLDIGRAPESVRLAVSRKVYRRLRVGQVLEVTVNPRRKRIKDIRPAGPAQPAWPGGPGGPA